MTDRDRHIAPCAKLVTFPVIVFLVATLLAVDETTSRILATVEGEPITIADVDREIAIAFPNRQIDPQDLSALRTQTREQLIRRQCVLRYLNNSKQSATPADIELAIERLKKQLALREESYDEYLRRQRLDEAGLRRAIAWQIGWSRLLAKYLTDANLQRYFEKHRRDFDGTEVRVAHVLLAVSESADAGARAKTQNQAVEVLTQLRTKQLTFDEAARRFSSGPSRQDGGDIGFISRHEPMPESFSRAAFSLEVNQISDPVETAFGFHLIRCLAITPGQKHWDDVRAELELAVTEYLFQWAADQGRSVTKIERIP